ERIEKKARSGEQDARKELTVLQKTHAVLAEGDPVRSVELADHEARWIRGLHLLTSKPVLYVANVGEEDLPGGEEENEHVRALEEAVEAEGGGEEAEIVTVCTKIESELAELEPEERKAFLEELGLERSGLERLINAAYRLLGLITFFTTGPKETRAWTVRSGATAPEAAGQIHTDFQRGFIRAETISFDELMEAGSMKAARERGLIRAEGRDYEVRDGDVILFRFNV
ncbi:MAG: DUF933 domain-containing protein, partial [Longimicrobiales bacterium]